MNLAALIRDAVSAALLAAVLFFPVLGLVLDRYTVVAELPRAAAAVALVFAGRLGFGLAGRAGWGARLSAPLGPLRRAADRLGAGRLGALARARPRAHAAALLAALVLVPFLPFSSNYLLHVMTQTLIYVLLAMGLNIVVGLAGLLDLGFVAFYAVGAYSYALLALHGGVSFWLAIPAAAAIAALAGCALGFPVLRMNGDYLAIVILGFGEIVRMLITNLTGITGGPNGLPAPRPTLFGLSFTNQAQPGQTAFHEFFGLPYSPSYRYLFMYLVILGFTVLGTWVFTRLREMPIGRAWEALREDEVACKALGINPVTTKLSAFTLGATFGGVGGVFFAGIEGFINPTSFNFIESALILSIVVLGGMGSVTGVVLAAVGITLLPEVFREFGNYRMLVFGLAMVFIMVWRPGGLLQVKRRRFREAPHAG
jgi:branched-chain amino acid transport system permease protein